MQNLKMIQRLGVAAGVLLLALAPAANAAEFGSGVAKSETRMPGSFTRIEASGATLLEVTAGQSATVVIVSGDDNIVPLVKTTVTGNVLRIDTEGIHSTRLPLLVKIGMPALAGIEASGASKISVANLAGERFELSGSGSTKAILGGTIDKLVIRTSGAGRVDAGALVARNAEIDTSGAANVEVNASEQLNVSISGAGKVTYLGNPVITKRLSGAGRIAAKK